MGSSSFKDAVVEGLYVTAADELEVQVSEE